MYICVYIYIFIFCFVLIFLIFFWFPFYVQKLVTGLAVRDNDQMYEVLG